jgi:hypothetical protein
MTDHLYSCLISNQPSAGFFGSTIDADGLPVGSFDAVANNGVSNERSEAQAAELHRLVKAAKCPTGHFDPDLEPFSLYGMEVTGAELKRREQRAKYAALGDRERWEEVAKHDNHPSDFNLCWHIESRNAEPLRDSYIPLPEIDITGIYDGAEKTHDVNLTTGEITRCREYVRGVGTKAVVEYRKWADEYRIRTKGDAAVSSMPPDQAGPRYTRMLSLDGARAISESCRYMAMNKKGFTTFLTLTLDSAARCRVEIRESVGPCTELEYKPKTKKREAHYVPKVTRLHGCDYEYIPGVWDGVPVRVVLDGFGYDQTFQTVQKELSRFWDAANKIYQRGWRHKCPESGKQIKGAPSPVVGWVGDMVGADSEPPEGRVIREKLQYSWVVENPKNERGQDNPHIHILMRWGVPFRKFRAWADRIEKLWGQGVGHLEKIKDPECAGAYMAKAAGYLTKGTEEGENGGQGIVRGNRYGISQDARAPGWDIVGIYENGLMGSLVRDVYDHFMFEHGSKIQRRDYLKKRLEETEKDETKTRQKIGKALEAVRKELNDSAAIPHRPSKYQLVIKGTHNVSQFFAWAKDKTGRVANAWLPKKEPGTNWEEAEKPEGLYLHEFSKRLQCKRRGIWSRRWDRWKGACRDYWQAVYRDPVPDWVDTNGGEAWEYQIA